MSVDPEEIRQAREALSEAESARIAVEAVHEVRRSYRGAGGFDREPIIPQEAKERSRLREERRRREGYRPV